LKEFALKHVQYFHNGVPTELLQNLGNDLKKYIKAQLPPGNVILAFDVEYKVRTYIFKVLQFI
jgi:hypothetical protein